MAKRPPDVPFASSLSLHAMGLVAASLGSNIRTVALRRESRNTWLPSAVCLLTGLGAAVVLDRLSSQAWRRRGLGLTVGLLAAARRPLSVIGQRDLVQPYRIPGDATSRSFAHWLWNECSRDAELLCVKSDLGFVFQPELWKRGMSAVYLFHQGTSEHKDRIDSRAARLKALSNAQPLRLVFFDELPRGNPAFDRWLSKIRSSYRIGETREFVVSDGKPDERWLRERYIIMELDPKASPTERTRGTDLVARPVEKRAEETV